MQTDTSGSRFDRCPLHWSYAAAWSAYGATAAADSASSIPLSDAGVHSRPFDKKGWCLLDLAMRQAYQSLWA